MTRLTYVVVVALVVGLMLDTIAERGQSKPGDPCVGCACRQVPAVQEKGNSVGFEWKYTDADGYKTFVDQAYSLWTHTNWKPLCPGGTVTDYDEIVTVWNQKE